METSRPPATSSSGASGMGRNVSLRRLLVDVLLLALPQIRLAARRETVPDLETHRETQILALANVGLEAVPLLAHQAAQVGRSQRRMVANHLKRLEGPGTIRGSRVKPVQPLAKICGLTLVERSLSERHARIGSERAKLDSVDVPIRPTVELRQQGGPRRVAGEARLLGRDGVDLDHRNRADVEPSRRSQQRAAGTYGGPPPPPESQRDFALCN